MDCRSCSVIISKISVSKENAPVAFCHHCINPALVQAVDVTINHPAAGPIQHLTSQYPSLWVVPNESDIVRISVNYVKLNDISTLCLLTIPEMDEVENPWG